MIIFELGYLAEISSAFLIVLLIIDNFLDPFEIRDSTAAFDDPPAPIITIFILPNDFFIDSGNEL